MDRRTALKRIAAITGGIAVALASIPFFRYFVPSERGKSLIGDWWPGGFVCACHGSMFDYAGRVVRGPAPVNLRVPPHWFESPTHLIIGEHEASV